MSEAVVDQAPSAPGPNTARTLPVLVAAVTALAFVSWLLSTPPGLLGKADAVGYAICHRIDGHSLHLGDRQLPLCARCTGMYLGALLGLVSMMVFGRRRAGALPRRGLLLALLAFIAVMGFDGVNSYLNLFPGLPHLYEPQNWLRLITGMLTGLALAGMILPVFNQTIWVDWEDRPVLGRWRELGLLLVLAAVVVALALTENVAVLYPLALLSAVGVVVMLVAINTTVLLTVTRRENRAGNWRAAALPLLAGFALAVVQIGLVDAVRFAIFQTWGGLPLAG